MKFYLAYGSNLSVEQMLHRCPAAVYVGIAEIPDYRLLFKGSQTGSYLTIEPKKGRKVPVVVWKVSDDDEAALDAYEGYPRFYQKQKMVVDVRNLIDGEPIGRVRSFVYTMDPVRPLGQPTLNYYRICSEGYDRFDFDQRILERAYSESCGKKYTASRLSSPRWKLIGGGE